MICLLWKRRAPTYREAMMMAIRAAASGNYFAGSSLTDGLRAIRLFEQINQRAFDPFDDYHVRIVTNKGWKFSLDRKLAGLKRPTLPPPSPS